MERQTFVKRAYTIKTGVAETSNLTQVVLFGENSDALFAGLKEFQSKKLVMLVNPERIFQATEFKDRLRSQMLPALVYELDENSIIGITKALTDLKMTEGENNLILNLGMGDVTSVSAAIYASYLIGIKAFIVANGQIILLPMLKASFASNLSEKKLEILKLVSEAPLSFESLRDKMKMSSPLLSYHINGSRESLGLQGMGLIKDKQRHINRLIEITEMGMIRVRGYCNDNANE